MRLHVLDFRYGSPVNPPAAAARFFCFIHRGVGTNDELMRVTGMFGYGGETKADGWLKGFRAERKTRLGKGSEHLVGDILGLCPGGFRQKGHEFIPAPARDHVRGAQGPAQQGRRSRQTVVAGLVPEGVIDELEFIQVKKQQGALTVVPRRILHPAIQCVLKAAAIQQARQRIVVGHVADQFIGFA